MKWPPILLRIQYCPNINTVISKHWVREQVPRSAFRSIIIIILNTSGKNSTAETTFLTAMQ